MARAADKAWLVGEKSANGRAHPKRTRGKASGGRGDKAAEQWLDVPAPASAPAPSKRATRTRSAANGTRERRRLVGKLRKLEAQLASRDKRIAELEQRVADMEKADHTRPNRKPSAQSAGKTGKARRPPKAKSAAKGGRKLNANRATFEEFRNLGLSVTQSARLVAAREIRGGFDSIDDLDELAGFSTATIEGLRTKLRV